MKRNKLLSNVKTKLSGREQTEKQPLNLIDPKETFKGKFSFRVNENDEACLNAFVDAINQDRKVKMKKSEAIKLLIKIACKDKALIAEVRNY